MNILRSATASVAAGLLLLAGCASGSEAPSGPAAAAASPSPAGNGMAQASAWEILVRAKQALTAAKSFHVFGTLQGDGGTDTFDLKRAGADFLGTLTMGGARMEVLAVGDQRFFRVNQKMAALVPGAQNLGVPASALNRMWLRPAPDDQSFAKLAGDFGVEALLDSTSKAVKGDATVSDGRPAIVLKDPETGDALYVSTVGEPLPLKIDSDGGSLIFREFGAEFPEIAMPDAGNVFQVPSQKTKKS
ncbi:hypothetical protein [Actinoplanes siamensis]|uniref:Lipoprotein n=1 Tax=Actinoplanes siamensis TaxID=1223317 RepID=A0A919TKF1_9ACTN|nr:hypothetical protein [Actinoplanes siamensis]GIF05095.1 hypothetical protein Asi03nite_26330 [Actinoplanes siamensis]